jgi:peptidoglycan/LPS O-acetylase OafA/YrhL
MALSVEPRKDSRVPELDGVRGVAILLILLYHYLGGAPENTGTRLSSFLSHSVSIWWSGVDLFFVLSGFLIGGILIDHRDSSTYFKTFFLRRICRIQPVYLLWVALFFIAAGWLSARTSAGWYANNFGQLPQCSPWSYFLFIQNFFMAKWNSLGAPWTSVTWSLCIEEQFYLLMSVVVWLVSPRKLPVWLTGMIIVVPLFRLFLFLYRPSIFMYVLLPCRAEGLLLGVLCAWLVRNAKILEWVKSRRDWLFLIFIVLLCGMVYLNVFAARLGWERSINSFEMISFGYSWISLFYAFLLLMVVTSQTGPFAFVMRMPLLRRLGIISYCIYLIHLAINNFAHELVFGKSGTALNHLSDGIVTLAAFALTLGLAALSWKFLEKPVINWGHSFLYGNPKPMRQNSERSPSGATS